MRDNLVRLGISLLFLFCVYMIKGDYSLTDISPFKVKWMNKNQYKDFRRPVKTNTMQMRMYQFKLTKG